MCTPSKDRSAHTMHCQPLITHLLQKALALPPPELFVPLVFDELNAFSFLIVMSYIFSDTLLMNAHDACSPSSGSV